MKEGDYYRWSYQQHVVDKKRDEVAAGTLYWCCAKIAIFKNGFLRDIYWSNLSDGRFWTEEEALATLEIKFLGNESDIEPIGGPDFYEPQDVIDLLHPNRMRGGLYIRKGAQRSRRVIKNLIEEEIKRHEYEIERANRDIERLKEKAVEIETADLEKFWI